MRKIILLISLIILITGIAQSQTNWQQTFTELENRWMSAWKDKNEKVAGEIMADDFTLTSAFLMGKTMNKREWLQLAMSGYDCQSFSFDSVKVRMYNKTAVVDSWYHQQATLNGSDRSGNFVITDVWVKQNNSKWQVVSRHSSLVKPH
jgi:hypothetical protein